LVTIALTDDQPWRNRTALRLINERVAAMSPADLLAFRRTIPEVSDDPAHPINLLRRRWLDSPSGSPQNDADPACPAWAYRSLAGVNGTGWGEQFGLLAQRESSAVVRREMASAAVRHPGADVELLLQELSRHAEDAKDPIIPQLLWVALEPQLA